MHSYEELHSVLRFSERYISVIQKIYSYYVVKPLFAVFVKYMYKCIFAIEYQNEYAKKFLVCLELTLTH